MKKRVICRVCGYITNADKAGDKCPACGRPAKAFQKYTPAMTPQRELWLGLDIHPILVHFPVAISVMTFCLALAFTVSGGYFREMLNSAIVVASVLLPFVAAAAGVSGVLDGNVRFKKITTPLLIRKIVLGSILLASTIAMFVLVISSSLNNAGTWIAFFIFNAGAVACSVFLGLIGKSLIGARIPD